MFHVRARPPRHHRPRRRSSGATCSATSWCRATPTSGTSSTSCVHAPQRGPGPRRPPAGASCSSAPPARTHLGLHPRGAGVERARRSPSTGARASWTRVAARLLLGQRRGRADHVAQRRAGGQWRAMSAGPILAIETSCDETAAAVVVGRAHPRPASSPRRPSCTRPTAASCPRWPPATTWERSTPWWTRRSPRPAYPRRRRPVAVTQRPGLIGALLVGVATAKAIAYAAGKPLVMVDHLHGHIAAVLAGAGRARPALREPGRIGRPHSPRPGRPTCARRGCWARPSTTPRARPSTRAPGSSGSATRAGPPWSASPRDGRRARPPLPGRAGGPGRRDFSFAGVKTSLLYAVRDLGSRPTSAGRTSRRPTRRPWCARSPTA